MRIVIAGSSGLIGGALVPALRRGGHEVRRLVRREPAAAGEYRWDPPAGTIDAAALAGADAVVNLCGAGLSDQLWTHARRQILRDSRTEPTEVLAEAVAEQGIPVMASASAVRYYGDTGERAVTETATHGCGFLAGLCAAWEAATEPASRAGARVVLLRSGVVLTPSGGMLARLRPLFRLALGARLGSGRQYLPWISLADEVAAIGFLLARDDAAGPVNLTAPAPVSNAEFTAVLARTLGRPAPWRVPAPVLRAALGELAEEVLLTGQRALPEVLARAGFEYRHPALPPALRAAVTG